MRSFSPHTIEALSLVITGGSETETSPPAPGLYRKSWQLEQFFQRIGVTFSVNRRSRLPAVRECLEELNCCHPDLVLQALYAVTDPREYLDQPDKLLAIVEYLNQLLKFDGLELRRQGEFYRLTSSGSAGVASAGLLSALDPTNYDSVKHDFERALQAACQDPEDAVTSACATVESVCKCILDELNLPYPKKKDINGLVSEVSRRLNLSPARTDLPPDLEGDIKQILQGLGSVTTGIGALRTHGGDAHGRGKKRAPLDSRIARLAIHAASTVALFYLETWQRIKQNG